MKKLVIHIFHAHEGAPDLGATVEMMGKVEMLTNLGFGLEFARDAFIRFAIEGATVISL